MMKYPIQSFPLFAFFAVLLSSALTSTEAEARIGESKPELEKRLFSTGALAYRDEKIIEARKQGKPYVGYLSYLKSDVEVQVYHKPASSEEKAQRSKFTEKRMLPGWDLHVVYVNGKSALELYERSTSITEQELNLLLLLQADGQRWSKRDSDGLGGNKDREATTESERKNATAFGFQMISNDGIIRANKKNKEVLFIDAVFDARLAAAREDERNTSAPESVYGF